MKNVRKICKISRFLRCYTVFEAKKMECAKKLSKESANVHSIKYKEYVQLCKQYVQTFVHRIPTNHICVAQKQLGFKLIS